MRGGDNASRKSSLLPVDKDAVRLAIRAAVLNSLPSRDEVARELHDVAFAFCTAVAWDQNCLLRLKSTFRSRADRLAELFASGWPE